MSLVRERWDTSTSSRTYGPKHHVAVMPGCCVFTFSCVYMKHVQAIPRRPSFADEGLPIIEALLAREGDESLEKCGENTLPPPGLLTTPTTPFILDSPPHPWPRRSLLMCSRMLHADHGGPMWVLSRAWQCGEGSPTPQKRETRSEHEIMRRVSNRDRFGTCPPSPTFQFTLPACLPHALPPPSFRLPWRSKVLRHVPDIDLHHSSPLLWLGRDRPTPRNVR